ncbi:hypothetical protein RZA67_02195 [Stenotrophomonas sp. C3(2023)]|uniref:hypothetical protein n=1 Tax=Stenotrophomonas sp. C3(2023) TaxID=3080277 RepID=UPI00293CCE63|nr:hypothetical protein [Stenotrophomonas sp. C3(2023)]MDV3467551.1 hypothetical protein [Stenotrophomonas sp. C3(2023)]
MLLALLAGIDDDRAPATRAAATDLLGSGRALDGALRADLHALLWVLSGLHAAGRAAVGAALAVKARRGEVVG